MKYLYKLRSYLEFNNYLDNVMNKTERRLLAWQSVARMLLHSTHA